MVERSLLIGTLTTVCGLVMVAPLPAEPSPAEAEAPAPVPTAREPLTTRQMERFRKNLDQWKKLTPEQREELRKKELFRRKQVLKEIEKAIENSGLKLTREQEQFFIYRYAQERRMIEEKLRREMERKRRQLVDRMVHDLVREFSEESPAGGPADAPGTAPHP